MSAGPMTAAQLAAQDPALFEQIRAEAMLAGALAERTRLQGLFDLVAKWPAYWAHAERMAFETKETSSDLCVLILASEGAAHQAVQSFLRNAAQQAEAGHA